MLTHTLDPILFSLGPLTIRWYGLMLGIGILACLVTYHLLAQNKQRLEQILDLTMWLIIGGVLGARIGHIIFYNLPYFLANPQEIIFINHGGLSSHGLTIGLLLTAWIYQKAKKIELKNYLDLMIVPIPLLAGCIRIGNFFNAEIIGKETTLPWGIHFTQVDTETIFRHPQQLYEALIAFAIFGITFYIYKKIQPAKPQLFTFYFFLFTYFSTRFILEYTKEPHNLDGFFFTTGQMLSIPFIIWSGWWLYRKLKVKGKK